MNPMSDKDVLALASHIIQEIQTSFDATQSGPIGFSSFFTKTRADDISLYVRLFTDGLGQARYCTALGKEALLRKGRVLVIANIEISPEIRGNGLLEAILNIAATQIHDLDIIEFESVLNQGLAEHLKKRGFVLRDPEVPFAGSLFKLLR